MCEVNHHVFASTHLGELHHAGPSDDADTEGLTHGRLEACGVREVAVHNQLVEAFVRHEAQLEGRL